MGRIDAILAGAALALDIVSVCAARSSSRVLLRIQWVIRESVLAESVVSADKRS